MKVRIKKSDNPVLKTIYQKGKRVKLPVRLVADAFNTYNESIRLANLLFEAWSPKRMEAEARAKEILKNKLTRFGLENRFDWTDP